MFRGRLQSLCWPIWIAGYLVKRIGNLFANRARCGSAFPQFHLVAEGAAGLAQFENWTIEMMFPSGSRNQMTRSPSGVTTTARSS